jgi:hypothetical protein
MLGPPAALRLPSGGVWRLTSCAASSGKSRRGRGWEQDRLENGCSQTPLFCVLHIPNCQFRIRRIRRLL